MQSNNNTDNLTLKIRSEFPVLEAQQNGLNIVYLDNGATTQKPNSVINAMTEFYQQRYATVHRGIYGLSQRATDECDQIRELIQSFINAESEAEVIFTRGTTHAINTVAKGFVEKNIKTGQEIIITEMEHHANIVPWQEVCEATGAKLIVLPVDDNGEIKMSDLENKLSENTFIVSIIHTSNVLGTVNNVKEICRLAKQKGAVTLVDGAQSIAHQPINVQEIGCDFFCFSGHKMYGPTGIGVLYINSAHHDTMHPFEFGGDMIESVDFQKTTYAKAPLKFEAGTPPIVETIGLGAAIKFIKETGFEYIHTHEQELLNYLTPKLNTIKGLKIIGNSSTKSGIISFVFDDIHSHDVGTILDDHGVAVRAGHHCAQPLMKRFNIPATTRATIGVYNTKQDCDRLIEAIKKVVEMFR